MIDHYLEQASSFAGDIDGLILLIAALVGFWLLVSEAVFFGLLWRFRHREGHTGAYVTGEEKHLKRWITFPHLLVLVCDVFIIVGAVRVWYDVKQDLPAADSTVRIVGQQWAWSFVQPGPDNELDTADDIKTVDDLFIEVGKTYHFELESRDVLHSFSVPAFRLKQDAIPGRVITGWFKATKTGDHDIQCAEICGIGHGIMRARIHIQSREEHAAWVSEHAPKTTLAAARVAAVER